MNETLDLAASVPVPVPRGRVLDYVMLAKPRITFMVLVSAAAGFYVAGHGIIDALLFVHMLAGTALSAAGANALNMLVECDRDALMRRTRNRPLPAGRLQPGQALVMGAICSSAGVFYLLACVNLMAAAISSLTIVTYLAAYTPLKRVTSLSTVVGAIPGALPPVIGWVGAGRPLGPEAWILFGILFFWQLPHFLAIAWIYREDYAAAGFPVLTVTDSAGAGRQVVCQTIALIGISLAPAKIGIAGLAYLVGASFLGVAFLSFGILFSLNRTERRARALFLASVIYLPVLLALLALTRM